MSAEGSDVRVILRGGRKLVPQNSLWADLVSGMTSCSEGVVVKDPQMNLELVRDCETLVGLRDALTGRALLNWGRTIPIQEWEGVSVGASPLPVTAIELGPATYDWFVSPEDTPSSDFTLQGRISAAFGKLKGLERLSITDNSLSGELSSDLGLLLNLEVLDLEGNRISGGIPSQLGELENLKVLNLRSNRLTGHIPPELGTLAELRWLQLNRNRLTGTVPAELGNLLQLVDVWLGRNELAGCVPNNLPDIWLTASGLERC